MNRRGRKCVNVWLALLRTRITFMFHVNRYSLCLSPHCLPVQFRVFNFCWFYVFLFEDTILMQSILYFCLSHNKIAGSASGEYSNAGTRVTERFASEWFPHRKDAIAIDHALRRTCYRDSIAIDYRCPVQWYLIVASVSFNLFCGPWTAAES